MNNSVAFRTFMVPCTHHPYPVPELSRRPKAKPCAQLLPRSPQPPASTERLSAFMALPLLDVSSKRDLLRLASAPRAGPSTVVVWISTSLLVSNWRMLHCVGRTHFCIHSSAVGRLGCRHLLLLWTELGWTLVYNLLSPVFSPGLGWNPFLVHWTLTTICSINHKRLRKLRHGKLKQFTCGHTAGQLGARSDLIQSDSGVC